MSIRAVRRKKSAKTHPVSGTDTSGACRGNLTTQLGQCSIIELAILGPSERLQETGTCDGRKELCDVGVCRAVQSRQRSVEEVITVVLTFDLVSGGVAGSDNSDGAVSNSGSVILGEPAALTKRLESLDNVGPGGGTVGLDIDPEVESLAS